jgi:TctA family transporter
MARTNVYSLEGTMKAFATLFVSGAVGLVILKLVLGLIAPLFALVFGLFALTVKLLLFAAVAYFIYSLVRGKKDERQEAL